MNLSLSSMLEDAKRLSCRLRIDDNLADKLIVSCSENLKEVEALKEYQEDCEDLNCVVSSRPRAQLVLGIQQENRHIRQLQHENKELRAALEEHQNATELIMSKYRQHLAMMVDSSSKADKDILNYTQSGILQDRADKICEMASVMNYAISIDEENQTKQKELLYKLVTENKGLRELLEISRRNGSLMDPIVRTKMISRPVQTEEDLFDLGGDGAKTPTTPIDAEDLPANLSSLSHNGGLHHSTLYSSSESTTSSSSITSILASPLTLADPEILASALNAVSSSSSEESDEENNYDTIKRQTTKKPSVISSDIKTTTNGAGENGDSPINGKDDENILVDSKQIIQKQLQSNIKTNAIVDTN